MKKHVKITIALAGGFVAAMLLMTIAIFFGYTKAYDTGIKTLIVRLVGIPIYTLTKSGSKYVGQSQGSYMGLVCGICMFLGVAIEEIIVRMKKRSIARRIK